MGRRGPAPTPTALLKLRGSSLASKRREIAEAHGPPGTPRCPPWLDKNAKAAWRHLVPLLDTMGVLTRIDGQALARYCRLWSRWRKMEAFIEEKGEMYPLRGDDGQVRCFQQWPQVAIANKLSQQLTRLEQEFGMTPSARARLEIVPRVQEDATGKARFFITG